MGWWVRWRDSVAISQLLLFYFTGTHSDYTVLPMFIRKVIALEKCITLNWMRVNVQVSI